MPSPSLFVTQLLILVVIGAPSCHAFVPSSSSSCCQPQYRHGTLLVREEASPSSPTTLHGVNKRRGQLGNNVSFDDDGNVRLISNKQKQRRGNSSSSNSNKKSSKRNKGGANDNDGDVVISPLLAQWAATEKEGFPSSSVTSFDTIISDKIDDDDDKDDDEVEFQILDGKTSMATQQMDSLLEEINAMISTNNCNVPNLVSKIVSLVNLGSQPSSKLKLNNDRVLLPTLKALLSAKTTTTRNNSNIRQQQQQQPSQQPSYRLAWAGSDDAICHIGTSLHKVPLARLQEIYLTLGGDGKNKWQLLEVIRILGPFPNVRNTLRGDVTKLMKLGDTATGMNRNESYGSMSRSISSGGREGVRMEIAYSSMIDGTGKEILASGESRVKYVDLDVWFANEKALVCTTVPPGGGDDDDKLIGDADPLSSSTTGSRILFFVAEENLEEQLEKLRAA